PPVLGRATVTSLARTTRRGGDCAHTFRRASRRSKRQQETQSFPVAGRAAVGDELQLGLLLLGRRDLGSRVSRGRGATVVPSPNDSADAQAEGGAEGDVAQEMLLVGQPRGGDEGGDGVARNGGLPAVMALEDGGRRERVRGVAGREGRVTRPVGPLAVRRLLD